MDKKLLFSLVGFLGIYLFAAGSSYFVFISLAQSLGGQPELTSAQPTKSNKTQLDLSSPKTEECPINGEKYTVAEKNLWAKKRPLTVMVENHEDSRPQSGLSKS